MKAPTNSKMVTEIFAALTIYGPMIYTAPRIRILMRADG
jgi:hypothetical protein